MHTEEYQGFVLETFWETISKPDDVPASFVWNMFDFSCYRDEGGISRMNTKGLVNDYHATQKDAYYFFKAVWNDDEPFAHITSKRFTQRHRAEQDIKVYSNCDDCVLYVNGKQVGCGVKTQDGVFCVGQRRLRFPCGQLDPCGRNSRWGAVRGCRRGHHGAAGRVGGAGPCFGTRLARREPRGRYVGNHRP